MRWLLCLLVLTAPLAARSFRPSSEKPPKPPREFRGAWVAVVHNIDWPSAKGLSPAAQKAELSAMLDRMAALNMNAVMFQVRPHCDAVYASRKEPWSPWLTGTMGRSPGYDPLEYCIEQAHRRGIEVHAWFNPFRALSNVSHATSRGHVCRAAPHITKRYGSLVWCDPGHAETRQRALDVILDVVGRYDVDGVHLDDYFYPYPQGGKAFPDGRSPAERRRIVDGFVRDLYQQVKARKRWVRVGISPFGIWRPGVPGGIEAGLDAYEQLGADSRKWLSEGWVDYLAPQLYWRDQPRKQSFSALLDWWRKQGERPVWPGIATARIQSSEDPGRPASEIVHQIGLSRTIGRNWVGHIHWSAKGLMQNRGNIVPLLEKGAYAEPALVPPMPWLSRQAPPQPRASAEVTDRGLAVKWSVQGAKQVAVMGRNGRRWRMLEVAPATAGGVTLATRTPPEAISLSAVDRYGNLSAPLVLAR